MYSLQQVPFTAQVGTVARKLKQVLQNKFCVYLAGVQNLGKDTLVSDKQIQDAAAYPELCVLHTRLSHQTRWPGPLHATFAFPM